MNPPARSVPVGSLLVVDDSVVQRSHAVALCRELGVQMIYEAASGAEALALLEMLVLPPELMIVDLEMPVMDGVELIERMHERKLAVPLIVASSRELALIQTVEAVARNLGIPVVAAVRKPLLLPTLRQALADFQASCAVKQDNDAPEGAGEPVSAEALERAIALGEIGVHFQPKVDMATGIVRGVEALARWSRPGGAPVRPDRFIALAEREGLILELTRGVMARALAQAAHWNAHGLHLSMAINLSPALLESASLVQEILDLLAAHALEADQVIFEVTEGSVVDCLGAALGVLARLRLKGFGLSIDDYGTGFSSLRQLARIPFSELKIDRSFVHGAWRSDNLRVILQSALDLARQLGLVAVAEGIETLEDWRLVQSCGCNIGQGYLIARPMPAQDFLPWLKTHQRRLHELRLARPEQGLSR
jgi:EAL domain-containing protein (putative c-di-GMP-specific phosphodiesterase class I)/AmiR/NasT family two-component response regulator